VLLFPLVFASSVFVPVSSMPDWLQPIAKASPVTLTEYDWPGAGRALISSYSAMAWKTVASGW